MTPLKELHRPLSILGTGHALPTRIVTSSELDQRLGRRSGFVEKKSGVRQRHVAETTDTAATLAAQAARAAMAAAGLSLSDIDCLVAASGTMDQGMPCNAALIHRELNLSASAIPAFDINASCMGFLVALDMLSWPIAAGRFRRVLIVASDIASCGLDWDALEASAIFGDGAAAAVVGLPLENPGSRILHSEIKTLSVGSAYCEIRAGGSRFHPSRISEPFEPLTRFRMDGKKVFKLAAEHLPGFVDGVLNGAGIARADIDWVVPHQASHLALEHVSKRLGFRRERVIDIFANHGNQVAASLPTALDCAVRSGRIRRGHKVLLLGTGAGLSLGGMVLEY